MEAIPLCDKIEVYIYIYIYIYTYIYLFIYVYTQQYSTIVSNQTLFSAWRHVSAAHAQASLKYNKYLNARTIWDPTLFTYEVHVK